jgi:hypothetical protein
VQSQKLPQRVVGQMPQKGDEMTKIDWVKPIHVPVSILSHLPWVAGIAAFFLVGVVKPYLEGADLLTTLHRPRPAPVNIPGPVKWLEKTKTVTIQGPIQVIHDLAPKEEKKFDSEFHLSMSDLHAEHKKLLTVLPVPKAPFGGEMAVTSATDTGKVAGIFAPKAAPFFELGGIRAAGIAYDPLRMSVTGYYRQDFVRVGPVVVNGRVYAGVPISPVSAGKVPAYGVEIGGEIRF